MLVIFLIFERESVFEFKCSCCHITPLSHDFSDCLRICSRRTSNFSEELYTNGSNTVAFPFLRRNMGSFLLLFNDSPLYAFPSAISFIHVDFLIFLLTNLLQAIADMQEKPPSVFARCLWEVRRQINVWRLSSSPWSKFIPMKSNLQRYIKRRKSKLSFWVLGKVYLENNRKAN